MPIVAIKIYKNTEPILEAPAPSNCRALVKDNATPTVLAKTIIQKKLVVKTVYIPTREMRHKIGGNNVGKQMSKTSNTQTNGNDDHNIS
jgi:hypothetical protein